MYQLHIANKNYSSWSLRPWAIMKALEIEFTEIMHPFSDSSDWQGFRQLNPSGKVPCLVDDGELIWDSLAIIEYLAERHTGVWPEYQSSRAWARCASAEMHSGFSALRQECSMSCAIRMNLHQVTEALQKDLDRLDSLFQEGLERFNGPFLAGENFTAVDAFFAPITFRLQTYGLRLGDRSMGYLEHILNFGVIKEWYESALNESYMDTEHDAEIAQYGTITEDFRHNKP